MDKCRRNIVVMEPSKIVYEGLYALLSKSEFDYSFFNVDNLDEIENIFANRDIALVLINPIMAINKENELIKIKKRYPEILWIGIIYASFNNSTLRLFDSTFQISDDLSEVIRKINKICDNKPATVPSDENLSERETDVLKLLAKGLSNKAIADQLNISVHTVNSHRKNIMGKTGIRSLAGLTVYAVTKKIISLD